MLDDGVEVLHVVGRAVVVAGTALIVDVLALAFPDLAARVTGRRSSVVAFLGLSPACGTGVPAAFLIVVFGELDTVPVAVGDDAVAGSKTFGLLLLGDSQLLVADLGGR